MEKVDKVSEREKGRKGELTDASMEWNGMKLFHCSILSPDIQHQKKKDCVDDMQTQT